MRAKATIAAVMLVLASAGPALAAGIRIDPDGRHAEQGSGIDPNGRDTGGAMDPNGRDEGAGLDPNGRGWGIDPNGRTLWERLLGFLLGWR